MLPVVGASLDMESKSCNWLEGSGFSIFEMHRMMDSAVWGGGTTSTGMRPM